MSRSVRTLATIMVVVALSSWSCGSTAPDATRGVAAIIVSPASSTIALNTQLPLQAQVQDGSGASFPTPTSHGRCRTPVSSACRPRASSRRWRRDVAGRRECAWKVGHRDDHRQKVPVAQSRAPQRADVMIGATFQLTAAALDAWGNAGRSSDRLDDEQPGIATVNASGLVAGVGVGPRRSPPPVRAVGTAAET